jgi:hypothetical protein
MNETTVNRDELSAIRARLNHVNPLEVYDELHDRGLVRSYGDDYLPQLQKALEELRGFCKNDARCFQLVGAVESAALSFGGDAHSDGIRFAMQFTREFRAMSQEVLGISTTV